MELRKTGWVAAKVGCSPSYSINDKYLFVFSSPHLQPVPTTTILESGTSGEDLNDLPVSVPFAPTFVEGGPVIAQPDIQVVFYGTNWLSPQPTAPWFKGTPIAPNDIMQALTSIVSGPYLSGLAQYGYTGPCFVRTPITINQTPLVSFTAPGPNVDQGLDMAAAMNGFLEFLVMGNHLEASDPDPGMFVIVILDPTVPLPNQYDNFGNINFTAGGAHGWAATLPAVGGLDSKVDWVYAWIGTQLLPLDQITQTISHELVEAISDPYPLTGVVTTNTPTAYKNYTEIGDVCNQGARVDGVAVAAYYSVFDNTCIVPTEHRTLYLSLKTLVHNAHDGPTQTAFHNFGVLCASGDYDYVDRRFDNKFEIDATLLGYQTPVFAWSINGVPLSAADSTVSLVGSVDTAVPPSRGFGVAAKLPVIPLHVVIDGPSMVIDSEPGVGNVDFTVSLVVTESWDTGVSTSELTSQRKASVNVTLTGQQIQWGEQYNNDLKACLHRRGLVAGPVSKWLQKFHPGGPPPEELIAFLTSPSARAGQTVIDLGTSTDALVEKDSELAEALNFLSFHRQYLMRDRKTGPAN